MVVSGRFLNLIKGNSSYRGTKGLVFVNSATAPQSRKLSTVGSGSESSPNMMVDMSFPGTTSLYLVDLRGKLFNTSTFREVPELAAVRDISYTPRADNLLEKLKMEWRAQQLINTSTFGEEDPESAALQQEIASYRRAADADNLKKRLPQVAELKMDWFHLPAPVFSFHSIRKHCCHVLGLFPLTDRKVLINHPSTGTFFFDLDTYDTATVPNIHHKRMPISLFVPNEDSGGGSLYIMESNPYPEVAGSMSSDQFEVLVYDRSAMTSPCQAADSRLLPPPPFICDPAYRNRKQMTAYAAVGSDIYISSQSVGTYCLDTLSNRWERVGQWTLPFYGKVEYVPELKLWFGLSTPHGHLAAADLSDMNSQPQLIDTTNSWKEPELHEEWMPGLDSHVVNLGSGRLCIARTFCRLLMDGDSIEEINRILVLTGVEVTSAIHDGGNRSGSSTREMKLAIRQHKSMCHISEHIKIAAVF